FRSSLETAMNDLLQVELSAFLGYEPYDKAGYNTGNSRNGAYTRRFETKYGVVNLLIPRDRNGEFSPALIPSYGRRDNHLEEMVIKLYQTGVTTREISDIIERMYGHHYSPATVSNISKATQENVASFHERSLEANYTVLYLDGTYLPLRRGTVSKECIHIALGVTSYGHKAILGYDIAPNENNASWSDLLERLKGQGVQQVSLVVTDGFNGLDQLIQQAFPMAKQQRCLVHIGRNIASNELKDYSDAVSSGLTFVSKDFNSFNGQFSSASNLDWIKTIKTGMEVRKEAKEVSIKKTKNTVENINKVERGLSYGSTANVMRSEAVASAKK
ncbi:hypothetical protein SAG0135_04120, partial [Streptococcus agalactiae LMG 14609]